jgi:hypothetical protein
MFADKHVYEDGTMEELIKEIEGYWWWKKTIKIHFYYLKQIFQCAVI